MIILDSNVISELMRADPSVAVHNWIAQHPADELFTTSITEAEILYGIELLPKGKRRDALFEEAEGLFSEDFAGRIIAFDSAAARAFAIIAAHRRSIGRPANPADAQIAAIARVHGAALATRNVVDFEHCGVTVVNPWSSS